MWSDSDRALWEQHRAIDTDLDADGDPDQRAAEKDALAATLLERHPGTATLEYDRGLYAKWRRDWAASAEHNRRALELIPEAERAGDPAAWNLGIAATAMRDWPLARFAWAAYGVKLPDGPVDAEIAADLGMAPVRLNAPARFIGEQAVDLGPPEVVWGVRLCPSRIRLLNVPTVESGHHCGDVVLHDGDPVGTRHWDGHEYSVFNQIALWERSPLPTMTVTLTLPGVDALEELDLRFEPLGITAEDWSSDVAVLCRACSEGEPDAAEHDHPIEFPAGAHTFGISGEPDRVAGLLADWAGAGAGRSVEDLRVALA